MSIRNESLQIVHAGAPFAGTGFVARVATGWRQRREAARLRADLRRLMATDEHLVRDLGFSDEALRRVLGEDRR